MGVKLKWTEFEFMAPPSVAANFMNNNAGLVIVKPLNNLSSPTYSFLTLTLIACYLSTWIFSRTIFRIIICGFRVWMVVMHCYDPERAAEDDDLFKKAIIYYFSQQKTRFIMQVLSYYSLLNGFSLIFFRFWRLQIHLFRRSTLAFWMFHVRKVQLQPGRPGLLNQWWYDHVLGLRSLILTIRPEFSLPASYSVCV